MIWQSLFKDWNHFSQTVRIDRVHFVDDRFEILQFMKAFEYHSELVSSDTAIIEENSVDNLMVKELTSRSQTSAITIR